MLTGRFAQSTGENAVTASMWFHVGANMDQRINVFVGTMTAAGLGLREIGSDEIISLAAPSDANRTIGTLESFEKNQQTTCRSWWLPKPS